MRLAVSNIGWGAERDAEMYESLVTLGFDNIEIAPTRVFSNNPYDDLVKASEYAEKIKIRYNLTICSMQSIWYGMSQRIAASPEERSMLMQYSQKAVLFAEAIGCRNLVFGCPKNRSISMLSEHRIVELFLKKLAEFAYSHNVVIALEPNPPIYQTNYINSTDEAIELIRRVSHPALMLNLDFGTIIENRESIECLDGNIDIISHVHISEPMLKPIKRRREHFLLREILEQNEYRNVVSLEMGKTDNTAELGISLNYLKEVFG